MTVKHTPGPWNVSESGSIEFADGYIGEAYSFNGTTKTDLPMMANARLIAAAPEMLDALKALIHAYSSHEFPALMDARERAKELIAKLSAE